MNGGFDEAYTLYQTERNALRRWIRRVYLRGAASKLRGPTLDFGCGIGELLSRLPLGSIGLEYNKASVAHCRALGLEVDFYDGYADGWQLSVVPSGRRFDSMIISHVLEHLESPVPMLASVMGAARKLGVTRILVIVPGRAGFRIDETHRTFVDLRMLSDPSITRGTGFALTESRYFPGDFRVLGDWIPHHELQVLFQLNER